MNTHKHKVTAFRRHNRFDKIRLCSSHTSMSRPHRCEVFSAFWRKSTSCWPRVWDALWWVRRTWAGRVTCRRSSAAGRTWSDAAPVTSRGRLSASASPPAADDDGGQRNNRHHGKVCLEINLTSKVLHKINIDFCVNFMQDFWRYLYLHWVHYVVCSYKLAENHVQSASASETPCTSPK